jgi:hypothetical protein
MLLYINVQHNFPSKEAASGTEVQFVLERAGGGAVVVLILGHGFRGGAKLIFLILDSAKKSRGDGFFLAELGGEAS